MTNKYEERLGTERMLPLVFKMALPAVAAQFVNLLYSIVDRIYIGHIPGIGTDALAGVGVTISLVVLISSFSAIVGGGGAPLAAIALGQGNRRRAGKILGNGFTLLILFTLLTSFIAYTFMEPILLFTGASEHTLGYAEDYLSIYLLGTLFVEVSTGLNAFINAQGRPAVAMCSVLIGALLNILVGYGSERCCVGYGAVAGLQCGVGAVLPILTARFPAFGKAVYEAGKEYRALHAGARRIAFYHGEYGKLGGVCAQQQSERIRRYLCQCAYRPANVYAVCQRAADGVCAGGCSGGKL